MNCICGDCIMYPFIEVQVVVQLRSCCSKVTIARIVIVERYGLQ